LGEGRLVDAETGSAVWPAVISITWTMRREGGIETRTLVRQKRSGVEGGSERFYVSPWRTPAPTLAGFEVAYDRAPLVRAYARGYRKSADVPWKGGDAIGMRKLAPGRDAIVAELRSWRRDIDAALASASNREEALDGQWLLVTTLEGECRTLTADLHAGICFTPDSELGRFATRARSEQREMWETVEGAIPQRVVVVNSGHAIAAAAPAGVPLGGTSVISPQAGYAVAAPGARAFPATMGGGQPVVRGFSIEPRKP
jgi:hypothetical protein